VVGQIHIVLAAEFFNGQGHVTRSFFCVYG